MRKRWPTTLDLAGIREDENQEGYAGKFEGLRHEDERGEYWSARELLPLLGYNKWQRAEDVMARAKAACEEVGVSVREQFTASGKSSAMPRGGYRRISDYRLTRFAAYLVAQNCDPRGRPQVGVAQAYFAVSAQELRLLKDQSEQEKRLRVRERVEIGNVMLEDAAISVGVPSDGLDQFHDAGYRGLYDELDRAAIKDKKGIPTDEDVLDWMGRPELAANEFRITQAEVRLRRGDIDGQTEANEAH